MVAFCDNCLREIVGGKYVYSREHKYEGKKFCSSASMEQYYRSIKKKEVVEQPKPVEEKPKPESKSTKPEKTSPISSDKSSNIN
jgi:hypothetical protein